MRKSWLPLLSPDSEGGGGGGDSSKGGSEKAPDSASSDTLPANKDGDVKDLGPLAAETAADVEASDVADLAKARELIAKLRDREKQAQRDARELANLRKAETERQNAELSETDRLRKERDEAVAERVRLERERLAEKAAARYKLPAEVAARLQGTTAEELEADAKQLARFLKPPAAPDTEAGKGNKPPAAGPGSGHGSQGNGSSQKRYIFQVPGEVQW